MYTIKMTWKEISYNGDWTTEDAWYVSGGFCFNIAEATRLTKKKAKDIANTLAANNKFRDPMWAYDIVLNNVRIVKA